MMKTSQKGIDLIKKFEGFKSAPYRCPAGVWTIGYGTTQGITQKSECVTEKQAEELLRRDLIDAEATVRDLVRAPLAQHQFDALVSFVYNVGRGNFKKSTLLRLLNQQAFAAVPEQFLRFNWAAGVQLVGLTKRRKAEMLLFQGIS